MEMESLNAKVSGQVVVILGAGASRDEASGKRRAVMPPLDADFFEQVQALEELTPSALRVLEVARELFGPEPAVTMEQFFTQIEFFAELSQIGLPIGSQADLDREPGIKYRDARKDFVTALVDVLHEAGVAQETSSGFPPDSDLHQRLAVVLRPLDAIITFNYDTLVDYALREKQAEKWTLLLPVGGDSEYWRLAKHRMACNSTSLGAEYPPAIHVHKMHGSINWMLTGDDIHLVRPPFRAESIAIMPPAWHKPVRDDKVFSSVWSSARIALSQADILVIAGYSLPRTDMLAQALLRATAAVRIDRPFSHVMIANPDDSTVEGLVSVIGSAIGPGTRIRRFGTFRELALFLHPF